MHDRVHSRVPGSHLVVVGVWDPVSEAQAHYFRDAVSTAAAKGLKVLAVTLDPDPVAMLRGPQAHPTFQDVEYRLWVQGRNGVHSRIVASLSHHEVEQEGVSLLLDKIRHHVVISELQLKRGQSLGREERGNLSTIRTYCARFGIRVTVSDRYRSPTGINDARAHLRSGRLAHARKLLSQNFYYARPASEELTLPWPPGTYKALPIEAPLPEYEAGSLPIEVSLRPCGDGSHLRWPEVASPWLAFVSGPGDC